MLLKLGMIIGNHTFFIGTGEPKDVGNVVAFG